MQSDKKKIKHLINAVYGKASESLDEQADLQNTIKNFYENSNAQK